MSRPAAKRPSLAILALPMAAVLVAALLAGLGMLETWVVYALVPVAAVVGGLGFMRGLQRFHRQHAEDVDRLVASGRWTRFGGEGDPEPPDGALSFPKRKPLASKVGHRTGGTWLRTRVDGREVWTLELGVEYRTGATRNDAGGVESGGGVSSDPYFVVLTHLDRGFGQVDVAAAGRTDALRTDVTVGVPDFDKAFRVTTESARTAREWLGGGCGADLARQGADALHGGRLRLDGRTLVWWRKGHQDLGVLTDVAGLVARAAAYVPR